MSLAAYVIPRDGPRPAIAAEMATVAPEPSARVHDPVDVHDSGCPPADAQRQGRPPGPPRPPSDGARSGRGFVPPRGPIEQAIAEVWTELLGGEPAGAHDNFFERGGHSLLAVQLLARLRHTFDVEPSLKDFLEEPTIARLASAVETAMADGGAPQAPPLTRVGRDTPLAGFIRTAAALVPRSDGAGPIGLSRSRGREARRRSRHPRPREGPQRSRTPT